MYAVAGTLRAVRFDPATRTVTSDPVPVLGQILTHPGGAAEFSVSRQGALVYVPGSSATEAARSLVWVTRQGQEAPIKAPHRAYMEARLSPDGTRVALDIRDQQQDIWIWDLARQTLTRLTNAPVWDSHPVWTPPRPADHFHVHARRPAKRVLAGGRQHRPRREADDEP